MTKACACSPLSTSIRRFTMPPKILHHLLCRRRRDLEIEARVEENALMAATLRELGHDAVEFYEMAGLHHATVEQGGPVVPGFIERTLQPKPR